MEQILYVKAPTLSLVPIQPSLHGYLGSFPQLKRPEPEGDHLVPPNLEVNDGRSYTHIPLIHLNEVDRDSCKFADCNCSNHRI